MSNDILENLTELFEYFEMGEDWDNEWPSVSVWSRGELTHGVVSDDLYAVLINLYEAYLEAKNDEEE